VSLPPVVLIGEVEQPAADHVWTDNVGAARALTRLLLDSGHRRVGVLGVTQSATSRLREQGYRQAFVEARLPIDPSLEIRTSRWDPETGYRATRSWLVDHDPPDALVCFTDSLALGALHAFTEAGIRVPDDVSVVGYDDVPEAAHYHPPLTTVGFDKAGFAALVLSRLAARIAEPDAPVASWVVDFHLAERASVRPR
jgi:DNA-binding LacI/PurR family transcriptional regulator